MSRILISIAILVISTLAFVASETETKGKCPERKAMKDLNAKAFAGLWYEIYRYDNENQVKHECVQDTFTVDGKGFQLNNTMRVRNEKQKLDPYKSVDVKLTPVNENGTAIYNITTDAKHNDKITIIDTDYKTYAFLWNCIEDEKTGPKVFGWILSKQRDYNVKKDKNVFESAGKIFIFDKLLETQQDEKICDGAASLTSFVSLTILIVLKQFL